VHGVAVSPDGRFVAAAENGMDEVRMYRFDAGKGTLAPTDPPFIKLATDLAPRHPAFHPNGKTLYILNEHASSVTALAYSAADGAVREIQTISTLPADFSGRNSTGQLQVDKAGKFLYASNRGHDSIAVFAIDAAKGTLSPIQYIPTGGATPRDFSLDPTGAWLFDQRSAGSFQGGIGTL
jgi:6-phosphogluconolactonase